MGSSPGAPERCCARPRAPPGGSGSGDGVPEGFWTGMERGPPRLVLQQAGEAMSRAKMLEDPPIAWGRQRRIAFHLGVVGAEELARAVAPRLPARDGRRRGEAEGGHSVLGGCAPHRPHTPHVSTATQQEGASAGQCASPTGVVCDVRVQRLRHRLARNLLAPYLRRSQTTTWPLQEQLLGGGTTTTRASGQQMAAAAVGARTTTHASSHLAFFVE